MSENNQWEYRIETLGSGVWGGVKPHKLEATLNEWGQEGWEIVNLHQPHSNNQVWVTMKRRLTNQEIRERRRKRSWEL